MIKFLRNPFNKLILLFTLRIVGTAYGQTDTFYYSNTFKATKPYRVFLPADYNASQKRYPVVYFFHGNQGDHKLNVEGVSKLVNNASVILIAWNGRSQPADMRPYNMGYHSNIKYQTQFKDYFLEFIYHIDSSYRTIPDRYHRALIGHSMGGYMSFFLAGKYPQLIGTAVSSKGSPEFFIGYPDNHTLYSTRYMFKNLIGVRVRFDNGTTGEELVNLNTEVHRGAIREKDLDYTYQAYEGGHALSPTEFKDAFDFVVLSFNHPFSDPTRWHHADIYPDFEVWGYKVTSNLREPGYINLKGVTKGGMNIRTQKWQPDGRLIPGVQINVTTAPVYKPNASYSLFDFNESDGTKKTTSLTSDSKGKIDFSVNYQSHQIGIFEKNGPPEIVFLKHKVNGKTIFLDHERECNLKLCLLNRGGSEAKKLRVTLSSSTEGIRITNPTVESGNIPAAEFSWLPTDFKITALNKPTPDGSPFQVRFNLSISDSNGNEWKDEFDAPVYYNVPEFSNIGIDDGDSEIFGSGDGDNIADPSETIMVYQDSHRTRLFYDDPYIDNERIYDELQPDKWGDGYALSSLVHISKDCPVGHQIRFLAYYEVKDWKTIKRNVTWGVFTITVGKADTVQK